MHDVIKEVGLNKIEGRGKYKVLEVYLGDDE